MIKSLFFKMFNGRWYFAPFITLILAFFCWILLFIFPVFKFTWNLFISIAPILALLSFLLGIWRMFKKEIKDGILQCIFSLIVLSLTGYIFTSGLPKSPYKTYENNIKNPNNVKIDVPLKLSHNDEKPLFQVKDQDILLYDYQQPGRYKYEVFLNRIESGTVYLKIFDLTTNRILSEKEIAKDSKMKVANSGDELKEFGLSKYFQVEEGEWGDYYGSRIEVWFQPDDTTKPERQLLAKNYVIQGW